MLGLAVFYKVQIFITGAFPPEELHFELVPHPRRPSSALSSAAFETPSNVFLHRGEFQVGSRHAMAGMICHPSSWVLLDFTWHPCAESPSATWWG